MRTGNDNNVIQLEGLTLQNCQDSRDIYLQQPLAQGNHEVIYQITGKASPIEQLLK